MDLRKPWELLEVFRSLLQLWKALKASKGPREVPWGQEGSRGEGVKGSEEDKGDKGSKLAT